jgi:hypothetical protein
MAAGAGRIDCGRFYSRSGNRPDDRCRPWHEYRDGTPRRQLATDGRSDAQKIRILQLDC